MKRQTPLRYVLIGTWIILCMELQLMNPAWAVAEDSVDHLISRAKRCQQQGDLACAQDSLIQVIDQTDADTQPEVFIDTALRLAGVWQYSGFHMKAIRLMHEVKPVVQGLKDDYRLALFHSLSADLLLTLGDTDEAIRHLNRGLTLAQSLTNPELTANLLNNYGNALFLKATYPGAIEKYKQCLELIQSIPKSKHNSYLHELTSQVMVNLVRAIASMGNTPDTLAAFSKALEQIRQLPDGYATASALIALAMVGFDIRELSAFQFQPRYARPLLDLIGNALQNGFQLAHHLNRPELLANATGYLGRLYEIRNQLDAAVQFTQQAVFHSQQSHVPEIAYLWQWQLGRLLKKRHDTEGAIQAYKNAVALLNPIRGELMRDYRSGKNRFNQRIRPVYLGLAEIYLDLAREKTSSGLPDAAEPLLRNARDTMEMLKTAELQDFFEDECVTQLEQSYTTLDRAPLNTAVIYPIPLADSLAILVTLPTGMEQIRVNVTSQRLGLVVKRFRRRLQNGAGNRYLSYAKRLYEWLIYPLEPLLNQHNVNTLIIAPDSVLRLIPFSALHDGHQFLVEKYALVTVPAVTLTDPDQTARLNEARALLSGLSLAREDFPPLPKVPEELSGINRIMGGKILQDEAYTVANLTNEFRQHSYEVVHMATHGEFGGTAKDTFLLTADGRLTIDRLEQLIGLKKFGKRHVELLTLSACQTALGDERAALGLAGIAIKAGARSAIASLWSVDDEATAMLIREFYRQLKELGHTKSTALQNAQKMMIARDQFHHPAYWSAFMLIGNWI